VLEAATTLPRNSEICDAAQCTSKDKQVVWVCYDACGRWCHIDYANITEAPSGDFIRREPYDGRARQRNRPSVHV